MRGGKREGAGRPPIQNKLKNWTIRIHEHEKLPIKGFLKQLRANKMIIKEDNQ
jgi:hypothetical protein